MFVCENYVTITHDYPTHAALRLKARRLYYSSMVESYSHAQILNCTWNHSLPGQGHHHNGDQAVRRPDMMCSICGRRFTYSVLGTWGSGWAHSVARPCILSTLLSISNRLATISKRGFWPPPRFGRLGDMWGSGMGLFHSPPMCCY